MSWINGRVPVLLGVVLAAVAAQGIMPGGWAHAKGDAIYTDSVPAKAPDREHPVIRFRSVTPSTIQSTNHKMVDVYVDYTATDNSGKVTTTISVLSNEPESGLLSGDKFPDWKVIDNRHVQLRAERSPNRSGRLYTITIRASDTSGNAAERYVHIAVPKTFPADNRTEGWYNPDKEATNEGGDLSCRVFPNPSSNYFDIEILSANSSDMLRVDIADVNGKPVDTQKLWHDKTVRVGQDLPRGVYYAEVRQGDQMLRIQLNKQ